MAQWARHLLYRNEDWGAYLQHPIIVVGYGSLHIITVLRRQRQRVSETSWLASTYKMERKMSIFGFLLL